MRLLGLYMKNCPEWILADQAAFTIKAATVPLYDTLGPESVGYVINQTELATVVCGPQVRGWLDVGMGGWLPASEDRSMPILIRSHTAHKQTTNTTQELENLVAAAPKCPSLKAAILTTPSLSDHHRHLARKGGAA